MFFKSSEGLARYSRETDRQLVLNLTRKRWSGCATMRSIGQFHSHAGQYCMTCLRRGVSEPKSTVRRPL